MLRLLIVPLSGIKSCNAVPSFYIKMLKQKTLQSCMLKHSIHISIKSIFPVLAKLNLFNSGRDGVLSPSFLLLNTFLNYAAALYKLYIGGFQVMLVLILKRDGPRF